MMSKKEKLLENPTPEEIEVIKKEAITLITERISRGDEFLFISDAKGEAALMIGGTTNNLSRVLSITMAKVPQLEEIITLAKSAHDFFKGKGREMPSIKDLLDRFTEELNCEDCPGKDDCPIKEGLNQTEGCDDPLKIMSELADGLIAKNIKPKGDC